ncbi:hypothetical protein C8R43DRAFT_1120182 [Mycena crocata]|nr:hypothetical protein C8R43DRAFT_1120182 [Mycena crocata]
MAQRTLRSNVRQNPYNVPQGAAFIDFHSAPTPQAESYPAYPQQLLPSFADEWTTTGYDTTGFDMFNYNSAAPSPVSGYSSSAAPSPSSGYSSSAAPSPASGYSSDAPSPFNPYSEHYGSESPVSGVNSLPAVDESQPRKAAARRGRPEDYVRRPRNAFIIFRSSLCAKNKLSRSLVSNEQRVSSIAATSWNALSDAEKLPYQIQAEKEKLAHREKYPDYRFTPIARARPAAKRRVRKADAKEKERCNQIGALLLSGKEGQELERAVEEFDRQTETGDLLPEPLPSPSTSTSNSNDVVSWCPEVPAQPTALWSPDVRWQPQSGAPEAVAVPELDYPPTPPAVMAFNRAIYYPPHANILSNKPRHFDASLYDGFDFSLWGTDAESYRGGPLSRVTMEPYDPTKDQPLISSHA